MFVLDLDSYSSIRQRCQPALFRKGIRILQVVKCCYALSCVIISTVELVLITDTWLQEDAGILENIALLLDILQGVKDLVDRREKGVNKEHQQAFNRVPFLI